MIGIGAWDRHLGSEVDYRDSSVSENLVHYGSKL